jgi:hypothetical protein
MIPIPIGTKHTAFAEGSATKTVLCEQCGKEYVYVVEEAAAGEGTNLGFMNGTAAQARAAQDAREALKIQLQLAWRAVPCPCCGWYQSWMVQGMRLGQYQGMVQLAMVCGFVSAVVWLAALIATVTPILGREWWAILTCAGLWLAGLSLGATAILLVRLRSQWQARYTPNDEDVEARKLRGQRQALPREEYDKMMRELRKKHII